MQIADRIKNGGIAVSGPKADELDRRGPVLQKVPALVSGGWALPRLGLLGGRGVPNKYAGVGSGHRPGRPGAGEPGSLQKKLKDFPDAAG